MAIKNKLNQDNGNVPYENPKIFLYERGMEKTNNVKIISSGLITFFLKLINMRIKNNIDRQKNKIDLPSKHKNKK